MRQRWPILLLGLAIVASTLLILRVGRDQTLVVDQWAFLNAYQSWSPGTLLSPHNGHLTVFPLIVQKAMFEAFGIGSHLPYQLLNSALSATVATLLFLLIRSRVGDLLALAAAILMLFYGAGADPLVATSQIANLIGLAAGLGMLLFLRRGDLRGDTGACLLLAISLASFSVGFAFAAGAVVAILLREPRAQLGRLWVVVLPVAAYAAWFLWARKFGAETAQIHNLKTLGSALLDQTGAALAGITGLFTTPNGPPPSIDVTPIRTDWAPALIVGLAALLIVRYRRPPAPSASALAAVTVLLVYFATVAIALNEFRNTTDSRLVYIGSVLLLLAVAELCAPYRPGPKALVAIGIVFVLSMCANVAELGDSARLLREESASNRAKLAAIDLAGAQAPGDLPVESPPDDMAFSVAEWHELERKFGSPAFTEAELRAAPPEAHEAADEVSVRALGIEPRAAEPVEPFPAARSRWIVVRAVAKGTARQEAACMALLPDLGARMEALVQLPPGGVALSPSGATTNVSLGRFADSPSVPLPSRRGPIAIPIPADGSSAPWSASLQVSDRTLVCPAGR